MHTIILYCAKCSLLVEIYYCFHFDQMVLTSKGSLDKLPIKKKKNLKTLYLAILLDCSLLLMISFFHTFK